MVQEQAVGDCFSGFKNTIFWGIYVNYCDFLYDSIDKYIDNEAIVDLEKDERLTFGGA